MKYFLAIDIGASSGRHMLGYIENGELKTEEIYRFPNSPVRRNGGLFWESERLFSEIVNGLARAKELGKIPESIAIDTWGVDYILIDKEGNPLGEARCYRDNERFEKAAARVHKIISPEELYRDTGIQYQPFNTVYQLYADFEDGALSEAHDFLMMPEYFNYRLSGVKMHESTNASTTGLINAVTGDWDNNIIGKLSLPEEIFKKPALPGTLVGSFTEEIVKRVGYCANVILAPSHDTASAVVASLAPEGELFLSSGTWSLLGVVKDKALVTDAARESGFSNEGYCNGKFTFLKNITGLWTVQRLRAEEAPELSFAELTELAAKNPTDARVDVNDIRFMSPENMKAELIAQAGRSLSLGECIYCALASLAESYRNAISDLEALTGERYTVLNILGGGSKNTLLNEMSASLTGKKIIAGPGEATVIGNLAMQMIAAGVISDISEAKEIIKHSSECGNI